MLKRLSLLVIILFFTMLTPAFAAPVTPKLDTQASGFVYDALAPIRYDELKQNWFYQHPNSTPTPEELEGLASQAFYLHATETPVWKPIVHWRMVGGSHPWVVVPRVQVVNPKGSPAVLESKLKVQIFADYGVWYPETKGAITNVKRLMLNNQRQSLIAYERPLEALATGDRMLVSLPPLALMPLLKPYPDRFPNRVTVQIQLFQAQTLVDTQSLVLRLYADLFALPIYLY
jgi:hypothetical protein